MRVIVVTLDNGPLVKVCESWDAYDEWFAEYGSNTFDEGELETRSARVYEQV